MGESNHSERFVTEFLESVADVVRAYIKEMIKGKLLQTGNMRPVTVIADKDTTKHRTRQVVSLSTFFLAAEILIQTLYIDHPIIKHHKAEDTAENIYDATFA